MQLLLVATLALSATLVAGFSMKPFRPGSREERLACSTLVPQHGPERQPPSGAYQLAATRLANGDVQVTLSGSKNFKGFIVQSSDPSGVFSHGNDAIEVGCSQATIRHADATPKKSVKATLTKSKAGVVTFQGTVVEDYMNFFQLNAVSA